MARPLCLLNPTLMRNTLFCLHSTVCCTVRTRTRTRHRDTPCLVDCTVCKPCACTTSFVKPEMHQTVLFLGVHELLAPNGSSGYCGILLSLFLSLTEVILNSFTSICTLTCSKTIGINVCFPVVSYSESRTFAVSFSPSRYVDVTTSKMLSSLPN